MNWVPLLLKGKLIVPLVRLVIIAKTRHQIRHLYVPTVHFRLRGRAFVATARRDFTVLVELMLYHVHQDPIPQPILLFHLIVWNARMVILPLLKAPLLAMHVLPDMPVKIEQLSILVLREHIHLAVMRNVSTACQDTNARIRQHPPKNVLLGISLRGRQQFVFRVQLEVSVSLMEVLP